MERAVWSQPPPGAAGAMSLSSIWAAAPVATPTTMAPAKSARPRPGGKNDILFSPYYARRSRRLWNKR
jgi:hypothetical protein